MTTHHIEEESPPKIGSLIQSLRTQRGMTLEDLSRIAGVSKSMLSEIERDRANPTIAVTWRLANAFGMGLDQLFASTVEDSDTIQLVSVPETPTMSSNFHHYQLRILGPMSLAGKYEWYELILAEEGKLQSEAHDPGTEEHLTVISGEVEITQNGQIQIVQQGETARYKADVPHTIQNLSTGETRGLLVVIHNNS